MHESMLTPAEAARQLGVHVGTIRRWTREGHLEEQRTAGGHRRIPRAAVERLRTERSPAPAQPALPPAEEEGLAEAAWGEHAIVHTRFELQVHRSDAWMQHFDGDTREKSREMGHRMMGLLLQHVAGTPDEDALWTEVRELANTYARHLQNQGLSLTEAVRATLFFRDVLTESTAYYPQLHVSGAREQVGLMRKVSHFMNEIQLIITAAYEQRTRARA